MKFFLTSTLLLSIFNLKAETHFHSCERMPGRPLQIEYREATFSSWQTADKDNRTDVFSGGVAISTYSNSTDKKLTYSYIWKEDGKWCMDEADTRSFSYKCKPFNGSYELRNKKNEIVGIVNLVNEDLVFKQVKKPFASSSPMIDEEADILKLSVANKETTLQVVSKDGTPKKGMAKLTGTMASSGVGENKIAYALGMEKDYISDCNGLKKELPPGYVGELAISCGNVGIMEEALGEFHYTVGLTSFAGSHSMPVALQVENYEGSCLIIAHNKKFTENWTFIFGEDGDPLSGRIVVNNMSKEQSEKLPKCKILGHKETLGNCKMPASTVKKVTEINAVLDKEINNDQRKNWPSNQQKIEENKSGATGTKETTR